MQGAIAAQSYLKAQAQGLAQAQAAKEQRLAQAHIAKAQGLAPGSEIVTGVGTAPGPGPGLGKGGVSAEPSLQLTPFFDDRWALGCWCW